jgi:hypothetical protein
LNYFNYFTEIEEAFIRRRGKNLLLSPLDWALIETWQQRAIPLHVVLRAIESVFDGFDKKPGTRTIKGLMYCREEVEAQFEEWSRSQAGKAESTGPVEAAPLETVSEHISRLIEQFDSLSADGLEEDLERVLSRLKELKANLGEDPEHIDHSLADIESFLDNALLTNSDRQHLTKLENEVLEQLKPYRKGMEAEAYENTFRLMLLKRLREENNVPRLSLFYL